MRLTKIQDALVGVTRLGLDTDAIIDFVQADPTHGALLSEVFYRISASQIVGFTSTITLTETLVRPLRMGDATQQKKITDLLLRSHNLYSVPVDAAIAEVAADLRARYNLRTPDALQAATALHSGCEAFLTNNDKHFRRVTDLQVLILNELEL